jgi:hypothetical protein
MPAPNIRIWVGDAAIGLGLSLFGAAYLRFAHLLPGGANSEPGAGAFPRFLGMALIVVGLGCAWRAWRRRADADERVSLYETNAALCAVALVATCLAFEPLGFVITLALFLGFLFWLLAGLRIWQAVLGGAAASGILWAIFSYLLGVGLPAGLLGD